MYQKTRQPVIVTLGENGCYYFDGLSEGVVPPVPTRAIDTIGAGDAHKGAVISALYMGKTLPEAIMTANRVSSKVVSVHGALLTDDDFHSFADPRS